MLHWSILVALSLGGSASTSTQNEHLKPLEWLIGTWEGTSKDYKDQYVYKWTHNKNFIKHTYKAWTGGKLFWTDTGMMGWDADKKHLVTFAFGMDGSIGWGHPVGKEENNTWIWEGRVTGPEPQKAFRVRVTKLSADRYRSEIQLKKGDKFVPYMKNTYKRKK